MPGSARHLFADVDFARGRLFASGDLDEVRDVCARVLNPHRLQVRGRDQALHARMDHLPLGPLSLNRLTWGANVDVDPDRLDRYYLISMPVRGRAEFELDGRRTTVSPGCAGVVSPARRFRFAASDDFVQVMVRIERDALEAGWQALTGAPAGRPIDFDCALPLDARAWAALAPALRIVAQSASPTLPARAARFVHARAADLLVSTLLLHQPHSLSGQLPVAAGTLPGRLPGRIDHARDWLLARLEEPVTLAQAAHACGVSSRTLQAMFQRAHGMGPLQWWRDRRLDAAHQALLAGGDGLTVATVAMRFGFTHLGEFARACRQRFGESPSRTLERGR